MPRKDIFVTILIGVLTGLVWGGVLFYLHTLEGFGLPRGYIWGLVAVAPLIFVFGLYLGKWLSQWKVFFSSFARFVILGFLNTGIDFGVFNLLMFLTGIQKGIWVSFFLVLSFSLAVINSYFWNKFWVFEGGARTSVGGKEFLTFAFITVAGLLLKVGVSSGIIFLIPPRYGLGQLGWNNIAAVFGTIFSLIWNFIGYRLIVFRNSKNDKPSSVSQIPPKNI
ncbi:MAG: GtrA family protein [Candidatus Yanofskybacteria bacterium]|nr:GtrA family protein [Candidatus Yanofskybacteria bacterium]